MKNITELNDTYELNLHKEHLHEVPPRVRIDLPNSSKSAHVLNSFGRLFHTFATS